MPQHENMYLLTCANIEDLGQSDQDFCSLIRVYAVCLMKHYPVSTKSILIKLKMHRLIQIFNGHTSQVRRYIAFSYCGSIIISPQPPPPANNVYGGVVGVILFSLCQLCFGPGGYLISTAYWQFLVLFFFSVFFFFFFFPENLT